MTTPSPPTYGVHRSHARRSRSGPAETGPNRATIHDPIHDHHHDREPDMTGDRDSTDETARERDRSARVKRDLHRKVQRLPSTSAATTTTASTPGETFRAQVAARLRDRQRLEAEVLALSNKVIRDMVERRRRIADAVALVDPDAPSDFIEATGNPSEQIVRAISDSVRTTPPKPSA